MPRIGSRRFHHAFTLIELAIVLVVIGLIVGLAFSGQSLVDSARARQQIGQINEYRTAFLLFRTQYDAWPGDMSNASDYWSTAVNGNGSFTYENGGGTTEFDGVPGGEQYQFFAQLSYAGMIKGQFNGSNAIGVGFPRVASNDATGILVGSAYRTGGSIFGQNNTTCSRMSTEVRPYLGFVAGFLSMGSSAYNDRGVLFPYVAAAIDQKMDDGVPCNGSFMSYSAGSDYSCVLSTAYVASGRSASCQSYYNMLK